MSELIMKMVEVKAQPVAGAAEQQRKLFCLV